MKARAHFINVPPMISANIDQHKKCIFIYVNFGIYLYMYLERKCEKLIAIRFCCKNVLRNFLSPIKTI